MDFSTFKMKMENGHNIERKLPTNATGGCLCGAIRYKIKFSKDHDFARNSAKCFCTACRKQSGSIFLHLHAVPIRYFSCTAAIAALGDYSCSPGVHRLFCKICGSFIAWQQDPETRRGVHDGSIDHAEETRQSNERARRGITARPVDGIVKSMGITGCAGDSMMQVDGEMCQSDVAAANGNGDVDFAAASSSPESTASKDDDSPMQMTVETKEDCKRRCIGGNCSWEEEGEVEICVGTLDEQFLVGRRDKAKNVIPNTGFGALVAHPEGRVLWAENEIPSVTDGVTGVRWKYGMDSGIKMNGPSFHH